MKRFYLGTSTPAWLGRTDVPLFVSRARLAGLQKLPRALGPWALDSGGFTQLSLHGCWTVEPERYADEVQRWAAEIGRLEWAAIQDHMCEDAILAKTGLRVRDHQQLTVESYLRLRELAPGITWAPVLQGRSIGDYMRHIDDYTDAGVTLRALPVVGVGSICRRQATTFAGIVLRWLADEGLRLHGFGSRPRACSRRTSTWTRRTRWRGPSTLGRTRPSLSARKRVAISAARRAWRTRSNGGRRCWTGFRAQRMRAFCTRRLSSIATLSLGDPRDELRAHDGPRAFVPHPRASGRRPRPLGRRSA